jgi:hypothetical protein
MRCQPFLALVRLSAECLKLTAAHLTKGMKDGLSDFCIIVEFHSFRLTSAQRQADGVAAADHAQPHCCFVESLTAYVVNIFWPFILFLLHGCRCCCHSAKLRVRWSLLLKQPRISKSGDCMQAQKQALSRGSECKVLRGHVQPTLCADCACCLTTEHAALQRNA